MRWACGNGATMKPAATLRHTTSRAMIRTMTVSADRAQISRDPAMSLGYPDVETSTCRTTTTLSDSAVLFFPVKVKNELVKGADRTNDYSSLSSPRRTNGVPWQVERIQMPYSHPRRLTGVARSAVSARRSVRRARSNKHVTVAGLRTHDLRSHAPLLRPDLLAHAHSPLLPGRSQSGSESDAGRGRAPGHGAGSFAPFLRAVTRGRCICACGSLPKRSGEVVRFLCVAKKKNLRRTLRSSRNRMAGGGRARGHSSWRWCRSAGADGG